MDANEIKSQLEQLKSNLEKDITAKAKADTEGQIKALEEKLSKLNNTDQLKKDLEAAKDEIKVLKDAADKNQPVIDGIASGKDKLTGGKVKAFNELLAEGIAENAASIKNLKKGQAHSFELKAVADMTFSNNFSTADSSVTTLRPGIIELPKRKLHIRSLLQGGSMGNSTYTYVKEVAGEGVPGTVLEGATKPQFDLDLQEVDSPAQYIAGWVRLSRKMLDDVQGMTTFLQSRLLEKLLVEEDAQILFGNGTSPNLSGITNTGNFTAPTGSYTIDIEQLVGAISQLELYDREANGILLNPQDFYRILLNKASTSGEYDLPGIVTVVNGQLFVAGVPCFRSTGLTPDKFIVGDWVMGANLITREAPRVEFFYEDGTNVRENKVTVRVEERVALPIYGNNYFIYGDFGNS